MTTSSSEFLKAQRHLSRCDPVLKRLIVDIGPCTLRDDPDRFGTLVRSIISQQISSKAALAIGARLQQSLGSEGTTPETILKASTKKLRSAGLSEAKARAVRDLADKVKRGEVPLAELHKRSDEEVVDHLLPVRGIGRWTAEMFLIFSLGRLDVLPVADWGLRVGVQKQYDLEEPPVKSCLTELAEPWRPFRSIATWYFWRSLGNVPQST